MCADGGAVSLKSGIMPRPMITAPNGAPIDSAARFAESVAGADELAGAPVFDGVFQPKDIGFGKVSWLYPAIEGFAGCATALGAVAVRVIDGVELAF